MPDTDKTCAITVHNVRGWDLDTKMAAAVLERVSHHLPAAHTIDVYPQLPEPSGFLEWIVRVLYRGGGALTIGCVRRAPEARVEFHT